MTSQIRVDSIVPTTGVPTGGGGGIVQVVQGTTQTQVTVSSSTYLDTTLEATITPFSANSKIFVIINQSFYLRNYEDHAGGGIRVVRNPGNNVVYIPRTNDNGPVEDYIHAQAVGFTGLLAHKTLTILDSPTTTNPITYKTQGAVFTISDENQGNMYFQYSGGVSDPTSYITLMEVSA